MDKVAEEMEDRIEQILDEQVRPYLRSHGGDVVVKDLTDGVLTVQLLGQCSNCPSNTLTTQSVIEEAVCQAVPEVKRVELDQSVSPELLDMARKILNHEL